MNRTIKFRVWSSGRMEVPDYINSDGEPCWWDVDGQEASSYPDEAVLMQFTGLLDKNGKEIYEGDIRKGKYYFQSEEQTHYQVMKWDEANACFYWDGPEIPDFVGVEVIGNIYENPELLKHD